jgi:CIC family chloride channel protein
MPALYLGAAIGAGCGVATARLMPAWPVSVESFALVGMGAFVAAATDAPITAVLLVFEATNDYALVPSLMLAVGVATIVRRPMERDDLYGGWLRRRGLELEQREAEAMPEPNPAARTSTAGVP